MALSLSGDGLKIGRPAAMVLVLCLFSAWPAPALAREADLALPPSLTQHYVHETLTPTGAPTTSDFLASANWNLAPVTGHGQSETAPPRRYASAYSHAPGGGQISAANAQSAANNRHPGEAGPSPGKASAPRTGPTARPGVGPPPVRKALGQADLAYRRELLADNSRTATWGIDDPRWTRFGLKQESEANKGTGSIVDYLTSPSTSESFISSSFSGRNRFYVDSRFGEHTNKEDLTPTVTFTISSTRTVSFSFAYTSEMRDDLVAHVVDLGLAWNF